MDEEIDLNNLIAILVEIKKQRGNVRVFVDVGYTDLPVRTVEYNERNEVLLCP